VATRGTIHAVPQRAPLRYPDDQYVESAVPSLRTRDATDIRQQLVSIGMLNVVRCRSRIKVLFWDGSGLWCCAKRLAKGRFRWPMECEGSARLRLTQEELTLLLGGIDLQQTKARNWYRKTLSESEKTEKEAGV
jgi:IS66 Orf2 like protein